jgi:hypothetical protein
LHSVWVYEIQTRGETFYVVAQSSDHAKAISQHAPIKAQPPTQIRAFRKDISEKPITFLTDLTLHPATPIREFCNYQEEGGCGRRPMENWTTCRKHEDYGRAEDNSIKGRNWNVDLYTKTEP